jgi:hypothetical protein
VALIGDRDRERAAARLRSHYLSGRLSVEELTDRLEVALTARHDGDVRLALSELPSAWHEQAASAWSGLPGMWRAAKRAAFVFAVWLLWWVASLVLLVGFVVSVGMSGVSPANTITFGVLWLLCSFVAWRATRRRSSTGP